MTTRKKYIALFLGISIAALVFSLFIFLLTSIGLDIREVPLKNNLFDNSSGKYDFVFSGLGNGKYYVLLKLNKKKGRDPFGIVDGQIKSTRKFEIEIDLRDSKNTSVGNKIIDRDSKIPYSFSKDLIEMKLLPFEAKKGEEYRLALKFQSSDHYFDMFAETANSLLVQEDYDYASIPWLGFFHYISKLFLIALFALCLLLVFILTKDKNKAPTRSD